jgi:hypothetical protein
MLNLRNCGVYDEGLTAGNVNISAMVTEINQLHQLDSTVSDVEKQLLEVRTRREDLYEMVGGKRLSDRKSPRRTATPVQ